MSSDALAEFGESLGKALSRYLVAAESNGCVVSRLCCGAAFESWLSFQSRLIIEDSPRMVRLRPLASQDTLGPLWLENEHKKVDLTITERRRSRDRSPVIAVEFKLIHNNKNWKAKVDGVWEDLFPSGKQKRSIRPSIGRLAVVGIVGAVFTPDVVYPGRRDDLPEWRKEVEARLAPSEPYRGKRVEIVWDGKPHDLEHSSIVPGKGSFFQLLVLRGNRRPK